MSKPGTVLGWLAFALVLLALFALNATNSLPPFGVPTLDAAYWLRSSTQIWILWILGAALVVASRMQWFTPRVAWLGFATVMVGIVAAFLPAEDMRHAAIQIGTAVVSAWLIVMVWSGGLISRAVEPGDYEAELAALCGGSRRAGELIDEEMARRAGLSRAGAAMAVLTRLRFERNPGRSL